MFGETTNSIWKNVGWAKKGILSFSNTPLNILSALGMLSVVVVVALALGQILIRLLAPGLVPRGITTLMLIVMGFGAFNLFALSILGEYVGRIFEEVKRRPHFVRSSIIRDGEVRDASEILDQTTREENLR
jgi:dolichol-phosphate mannosyltransferase